MYYKLINGVPVQAPPNFMTEDGTVIINFDQVANEYGYKELVVETRPPYDPRFQKLVVVYVEDDTNIIERFVAEDILSLDQYKAERIQWFDNFCNESVMKGFNAVGHTFRFNGEDQDNFSQRSLLLLLKPDDTSPIFWKTEDVGVIALTRDEFIAVLESADVHKMSIIQQYWKVKGLILQATSHRDVANITWTDGSPV
jgi:hypothetical protein